jgi:subtilisin family serine protease
MGRAARGRERHQGGARRRAIRPNLAVLVVWWSRRPRTRAVALTVTVLAIAVGVPAVAADIGDGDAPEAIPQRYVVLYGDGVGIDEARQAVADAGGTIDHEDPAIGVAAVTSTDPGFAAAASARPELAGAVLDQPIGHDEVGLQAFDAGRDGAEELPGERAATRGQPPLFDGPTPRNLDGSEPLSFLQWDMTAIDATATAGNIEDQGYEEVVVGVVDSGIDGSHPDIAPNLDLSLSASFTTDIPAIDGDCQLEADHSCDDPLDVDDNGHGTHVAGIIAGAYNGVGIAGVAPRVRLANLRAGQDSGFFFTSPVVAALVFAAEHGIDVVNLSFTLDPWLFVCSDNPADSPSEQQEQRTIAEAVARALAYARANDVTVVASLGNDHTDLAHATVDAGSPDYPPGQAKTRQLDGSCLTLPAEGEGVIGVSSVGPSLRKADSSNYGLGVADLTAPGGFFLDGVGTGRFRSPANMVLSAYPEALARARGDIDANGRPTTPFVVRDCGPTGAGPCAYYQYLQGTSMAAPHVAGVAALIVSHWGDPDPVHGGLRLSADEVERRLDDSARDLPCPDPTTVTYRAEGLGPEYDATCQGPPNHDGFFGEGLVNAARAVGKPAGPIVLPTPTATWCRRSRAWCSRTATPPVSAGTTSTCRARRWPHRTPPASPP